LARAGLLAAADADRLRASYVFWRELTDALRMGRGQARDLLLPEAGTPELATVARRLRPEAGPPGAVADALVAEVERHRRLVIELFDRLFRAG
jgi:glutamate-ammonia-ligase adenylyltransferase